MGAEQVTLPMVWVEGVPPEVKRRATDAVAAIRAANAMVDLYPDCPIARAAAQAAKREGLDVRAELSEFMGAGL